MLKTGDYVRILNPLKTLLGTIEGSKHENGFLFYLVRSDPRSAEQFGDCYVLEGEVELCERPEKKGEGRP